MVRIKNNFYRRRSTRRKVYKTKIKNEGYRRANDIFLTEIQEFLKKPKEYQENNRSFLTYLINELVERNKCLVYSIAKRYSNKGIDTSDILNEGYLALIESAYDFDGRSQFSTYAYLRINWKIKELFKRELKFRICPYSSITKRKKLEEVVVDLGNSLGRSPNEEEIINYYNSLKSEKISGSQELAVLRGKRDDIYFKRNGTSILDFYPSEKEETIKRLTDLINNGVLKENWKKIIHYHYYKGMTFDEIGEKFFNGLKKQNINQMEKCAIRKLRKLLEEN